MFGTCQAAPRIIAGMARRAEAPGPFLVRGLHGLGGGGQGEGRKRCCVGGGASRQRSAGGSALRLYSAARPGPSRF